MGLELDCQTLVRSGANNEVNQVAKFYKLW